MRVPKIFSLIPGIRFWLLSFSGVLMLLVIWEQLSEDDDRFPGTSFQQPVRVPRKGPDDPPILAYWIFGSKGESKRILRLLKAVYHPRNQYLLHLDATLSESEKVELAHSVHSEKVFRAFGNVNVVGKTYPVDQIGASSLAAMLHAGALLLKLNTSWDWFTLLSTSDYPLFTQDDILYAFKFLPRDLNFAHYTNSTTWFSLDDVSRSLMEHCINGGWDNLPRKLLMYLTNSLVPLESYFHTIICNTPEFQNTTVNIDLRYIVKDFVKDVERHAILNNSQAIFAGPLMEENDPTMLEIDNYLLHRPPERVVPEKWCNHGGINETTESREAYQDSCSTWKDIDVINVGIQGIKLQRFLSQLAVNSEMCTQV